MPRKKNPNILIVLNKRYFNPGRTITSITASAGISWVYKKDDINILIRNYKTRLTITRYIDR